MSRKRGRKKKGETEGHTGSSLTIKKMMKIRSHEATTIKLRTSQGNGLSSMWGVGGGVEAKGLKKGKEIETT